VPEEKRAMESDNQNHGRHRALGNGLGYSIRYTIRTAYIFTEDKGQMETDSEFINQWPAATNF
jgi:hypothetical protein